MTITFDGISIAASGMNAYQTWLDAIADNIANINTITATDEEPFQERLVRVEARDLNAVVGGVDVVETPVAGTDGRLVYDPTNPLADDDGMVLAPAMDLEGLMTDMIIAQRSFQANTNVLNRARETYERTLEIGQ
jgi:flagellar basal-body rod protein FlgC